MKAIRIPGVRQMDVISLPMPEPAPGELMLKNHFVGFCGSDLNTFRGLNAMAKPEVIPGHEIGAEVCAIGEGCPDGFCIGQTVTVNPYTACGVCLSCRNGRPNACQHNETLGVQRDGAMREYISLPWQKVIPVGSISAREAAIIEPMSVGFHAVSRGDVSDTDTVVVIGCGMVGLGAVMRASHRGASVVAVDLGKDKRDLAIKAGACRYIDSREEDVRAIVGQLTNQYGADVVIEAVGSPATYVTAVDIVGFTGRVVCIGYSKNDVSFQTRLFVQKELDIRGSRNAMPEDFRAVIRLLQTGNIPVDSLISGIVKPEQAFDAMKQWDSEPGRVFRLLVSFE
ncbi:MAG: zinc-binding alcohol dehydrogenase family protein [Bacteroidaceae bacterium]|nr:zinc-binding alcohol dehydrogenase family protein [Bacteroidaceae bacterium]